MEDAVACICTLMPPEIASWAVKEGEQVLFFFFFFLIQKIELKQNNETQKIKK